MKNPNEFVPREKWLRTASYWARETLGGSERPIVNGWPKTPLWWIERTIRVFCEEGISEQTIWIVVSAIQQRIAEVGLLNFQIETWGQHPSTDQLIQQSLVNGQLDEEKLFELCLAEPWRDSNRGGQEHADVIITQRQLLNDSASWGAASFQHGTLILALYGNRQLRSAFLKKVVLHEMGHLLGLRWHCDNFPNVEGYRYDPTCNMHYSCPSESICPKCLDYIRQWWLQVEWFLKTLKL